MSNPFGDHEMSNRKDEYFLEHLKQRGIERYDAVVTLVQALWAQEIKTAVASSSNNCAAVLDTASIAQLFDTRVDGTDITRHELKGKSAPDGTAPRGGDYRAHGPRSWRNIPRAGARVGRTGLRSC